MVKGTGIKGLYLKRGWFYYQPPTPKGGDGVRPGAVALETQDLVTAIQRMEERRHDLIEWQASRRRTLDEVLPRYYQSKIRDSVLTRRQRQTVLDGFSRMLGNPRVEAITTAMIEDWRDQVETHGVKKNLPEAPVKGRPAKKKPKLRSATTVKTYTIVVKAFFNWAVEEKLISESPMKKMKRQVRVARTKVQEFLTEEQRETAMAGAEERLDLRFILLFGFFAGLRDGEMLAMTPKWLWISTDGSYGTLTVQNQAFTFTDGRQGEWRPKVRELRVIPLHPRLISFLRDEYGMDPEKDDVWKKWRETRKPADAKATPWMLRPEKRFWPTDDVQSKRYDARKSLGNLAKSLGLPKLNYHILRHTFATLLVMKGVSLAEVAGLLGDTLQVTEETYAGYSPGKNNPLSVL